MILESLESSSSSSSEDDDTITSIPRHLPKSRQYFDLIADMDNEEFFSHFRMGRDAFNYVVQMVTESRLTPHSHGLTSQQKCLVALWYLGSDSSFRTTSQQFGLSMSTAHSSLEELVGAVLKNLSNIIKMPDNVKELKESTQPFYKYKFPNVVGAIDGTMIEVHPPQREKLDFFTRKYNTSVNLTALFTRNYRMLKTCLGDYVKVHLKVNAEELRNVSLNSIFISFSVSTKEKPGEDPSEFTVEDTNKLLWWWQHSGKQQMTLAKNNVEKSKVFKNMAAHLEEKFTLTAVKNRFNYIKRKYKQSLTHNQKSGNNPSSFQYASQCEEAFYKDRDVNPIGVIDSEEIETRTPEKRSRSRISKYQEEKLKIKREALQSKIKYRERISKALEQLANKL
ncbi:hypothetical protein EB796_004088 [Bugula neritina]|uniref:DDE Tnp4 domain-containing protein n=1 Tax=Bugula neritina TaxID=10212 RepID=A0A7J7KH63_BUGNE|nr:hypothetical protein EB796_004088 [Bugula neritina]